MVSNSNDNTNFPHEKTAFDVSTLTSLCLESTSVFSIELAKIPR